MLSPRFSRSDDGDLNVSGPSIDRSSARKELTQGREIEAKFFMPRAMAQKLTSGLPFTQIEQHYFKRTLVKSLVEMFLSNKGDPSNPTALPPNESGEFSIARIRSTREPGQDATYFIEFKGSKEGVAGFRISRREVSEPISFRQYKALREDATAGSLRKRRYAIAGTITVNGTQIPALAQIDSLQAAGKELHKTSTTFDTVDVELQDTSHIAELRAGHHSFEFLHCCIELSAHNEAFAKTLTTRRIAKKGLHTDAVKAIKRLEAEAQRRNVKDTY